MKDYSDKTERRAACGWAMLWVRGECWFKVIKQEMPGCGGSKGNYTFCHICLLNSSSIETGKGGSNNATPINLLVALIRFHNLSILKR